MKIQNNKPATSFTQLYINSKEAQKLLKKADRAVKASNAKYINTNIPKGHKRPLWSVLSEHVTKRQADNPNNIIIDISNKAKQLLAVITLDNKGYLINKTEVCPLPRFGNKNDMFETDDMYKRYCYSLDRTLYGRSDFFEAVDRAEFEVNSLYRKQLSETPEIQTSIRTHEKQPADSKNPGIIKNPRRHEKAKFKFVAHIQRPFENIKEIIDVSKLDNPPAKAKLQPKHKEKIPRKLKKLKAQQT